MSAGKTTAEHPFAARKSMNQFNNKLFTGVVWVVGICTVIFIIALLFLILEKGLPKLDWGFLYGEPSEIEEGGGVGPLLFNSFYVLIISLLISLPLGMASGIIWRNSRRRINSSASSAFASKDWHPCRPSSSVYSGSCCSSNCSIWA